MNAPEFDRFWAAWPRNEGRYSRKGGKQECLKVWNKNYNFTQVETILAHVAYLKTTEAWIRDQGAFIPMPVTYLRQQRWDGADIPQAESATLNPEAETLEVKRTNQWLQAQAQNMAAPNNEAAVASARERLLATRRALKGAV